MANPITPEGLREAGFSPHSYGWEYPVGDKAVEVHRLQSPKPELVLVTDLDGTLLGGSSAWRRRLYAWLVEQRERVLHIFCTGRDLRSVARLLQEEDRLGLLVVALFGLAP
jgi:hypothetical protein